MARYLVVALLALAGPAQAQDFDLLRAIAVGAPMTADVAAQRAVEVAPSVERAEALAQASEAALLRVRAALVPRLEGSARYTHIDGFPNARINGISIEIPRNQYALSGRLSYPVSDLIFATLPQIDGAEASVEAYRAQSDARRARVRLSAREAFFQLARARGVQAVAERALVQARELQASVDAGVRAGVRTPADGSDAAARLASAEQAVIAAAASVDVADASLRTLLQHPDGAAYGIGELASAPQPLPSADGLIARARAQRAEVVSLQHAIRAQRKGAKAQRASGYPHLSVYAGGDYAQPNRYQIPPRAVWQASWELGASLTYAPNDTLVSVRKAREDDANIRASEADLEELDRSLLLEVRTARATLGRTEQNLAATHSSQRAAEDAYQRRLAQLRGGEVTLADVLASEGALNEARLHALEATIDDRIARARLAYAVGE
ncbi:MAG TPA: TolC family protein [Polyangiales bacterium]|nr:TolC family protein [Polyangiales bacterium]